MRLHRARALEREIEVFHLPGIVRNASLADQPAQIPVGADLIEAVVVHAEVGDMGGHFRTECGRARARGSARRRSRRTAAWRCRTRSPASSRSIRAADIVLPLCAPARLSTGPWSGRWIRSCCAETSHIRRIAGSRSCRRNGGIDFHERWPLSISGSDQRITRAPCPFMMASTSLTFTIEVSPGVVIANAPCAAPYSTAACGPLPSRKA